MREITKVIVRFWRWTTGGSPKASRFRRRAFLFTGFFILAFAILQAPADVTLLVQSIFSARTFGHLIAIGLVFWLALRAAASIVQSTFNLGTVSDAQGYILQSAFNGSYATLTVRGGEAIEKGDGKTLIKVGGPGQVRVNMENAAVFERAEGELRVISPSKNVQHIRGFERLRGVIDLRDQVLNINLWGRTRDGIRVEIEGARVVYSILRGDKEASLLEPHPFDEQAALRLFTEQRMEKRSRAERGLTKQLGLLGEQGTAFFERQLQAFLGEFALGELLATPGAESPGEDEKPGTLFLARDAISQKFTARCEQAAEAYGLQMHWIDIGDWKVDELAQEILEEYLDEQLPHLPAKKVDPYQDSRAEELNRLFKELAQIKTKDFVESERGAAVNDLISAYYGLFDGLKLRYGELLGEDEQQIDVVLRFLKLLNKRANKQKQ